MGKAPKTMTLDIKVHQWLERYAKDKQRKESAVANEILRKFFGWHFGSWKCTECDHMNPYERKALASTKHYLEGDLIVCDMCTECYANKP